MTQTEAIREALDELGEDASTEAVREWAKTKKVKPGASFDSIVSHEKRKRRKGSEPDAEQRQEWIASLKEVRALLTKYGKAKFLEMVDDFEKVLATAGSCEGIRELVKALEPD